MENEKWEELNARCLAYAGTVMEDEYGNGEVITAELAESAAVFLSLIQNANWALPSIYGSCDGEICFYWSLGRLALFYIFIEKPGVGTFVRSVKNGESGVVLYSDLSWENGKITVGEAVMYNKGGVEIRPFAHTKAEENC